MKIYVYVDANDNDLIKELDLIGLKKTDLVVVDIELNDLPSEESQQFIQLEQKWKNPLAFHGNYILTNNNKNIRNVTWICYNTNTRRINIISPKKEELEDDKVTWGLHIFDETIKALVDGTSSMLNYQIEETSPLLTIIEKLPEAELIKNHNLLIKNKILFVEDNTEDFRMVFYRKTKNLIITPANSSIVKIIYITKKNDRTILYNIIRIENPTEELEIKKITLPQSFDLYGSPDITCNYMEK